MRFSTKIFAFAYCIFMLAMGIGSFFLINSIYDAKLNEIIEKAKNDNKNLFSYVASMYIMSDEQHIKYTIKSLVDEMMTEGNQVYVGRRWEWEDNEIEKLHNYEVVSKIVNLNNENDVMGGEKSDSVYTGAYIQVTSRYAEYYIVNRYSLSSAIEERDRNFNLYRIVLVMLSAVMAVVLYMFARYVTGPVERLTRMAGKISEGDYSVRINTSYRRMKSKEVKCLGETLNSLAVNTQEHIDKLSDMLEKREVFMADFTHEIKTPLTSIIGYGDILRTYDVSPEKRREYGEYIYKEGKRLERLSLNLLQLIVMGKQEIELQKTNTLDIMGRIKNATKFLGEKYGVYIEFNVEEAVIMTEQSLFITAIINFIDNACKASKKGNVVKVKGEKCEEMYKISVIDEGRGIPYTQLDKIMEPFYMVDKSRARKQGGAGIGLAICKQVAKLHGGYINVASIEGEGTTIFMCVPLGTVNSSHDSE